MREAGDGGVVEGRGKMRAKASQEDVARNLYEVGVAMPV